MTTNELQLLREFRAEIAAPSEETRRRIYTHATNGENTRVDRLGRRPRGLMHRRRRGRLASLSAITVAAGATLILGLTGVHSGASRSTTSKQSLRANPGTIRTVAFTLVSYKNGTAELTLTDPQVFDPPELQSALAQAGIPALVKTDVYCSSNPSPPDPINIGVLTVTLPPVPAPSGTTDGAHALQVGHFQPAFPPNAHTKTVINPTKMPPGTELAFDYAPDEHALAVDLVSTNSYTCSSGQPPTQ